MIEMQHGDTVIKVMAQKVEEMKRKGWKVKGEVEAVQVEVEPEIQDDSEEE
jgi:hypothetical protein